MKWHVTEPRWNDEKGALIKDGKHRTFWSGYSPKVLCSPDIVTSLKDGQSPTSKVRRITEEPNGQERQRYPIRAARPIVKDKLRDLISNQHHHQYLKHS